jgi:DNA replication protein DnaC
VLFTTAAALLMRLIDAKRAGSFERQMRALDRIDLLLIDELGYIPFEREATDLLFHLISARYERRSIALTTLGGQLKVYQPWALQNVPARA